MDGALQMALCSFSERDFLNDRLQAQQAGEDKTDYTVHLIGIHSEWRIITVQER